MPTVTVTRETLDALGVSVADLQEPTLTGHAKRSLEGMLASRGFDITGDIGLVVLPAGEGVILAQQAQPDEPSALYAQLFKRLTAAVYPSTGMATASSVVRTLARPYAQR